jgi:Methyltransferase domain
MPPDEQKPRPASPTGKLTVAPDPLPWDPAVRLVLRWEVDPLQAVKVTVAEDDGHEKLVYQGAGGSVELEWIRPHASYQFRLYGAGDDLPLLHETTVRRGAIPWQALLAEISEPRMQSEEDLAELAKFLAGAIPRCLRDPRLGEWFHSWEERGFHVTPVHFYQPLPDTRTLEEELWERRDQLVGVEMNLEAQLHLLREVFPRYQKELPALPLTQDEAKGGFYMCNGRFENLDPLVTYAMVRHFRPRRIIEVGGGFSTLLLDLAARANGASSVVCIEPYPDDFLASDPARAKALVRRKVEDLDLAFFEQLEPCDLLFIDSSHVVKTGGDVTFLFLQVLPRLRPGVMVHVHDIFLPYEYPREWVMGKHYFWTEQYLLQAFLAFNSEFEVVFATSYLAAYYPADLAAAFTSAPMLHGGGFWMRRKTQG